MKPESASEASANLPAPRYHPNDTRWFLDEPPELPVQRGEKPTRAHIDYIISRLPIIGFQHCPNPDPIFRRSDLLKLVEP